MVLSGDRCEVLLMILEESMLRKLVSSAPGAVVPELAQLVKNATAKIKQNRRFITRLM